MHNGVNELASRDLNNDGTPDSNLTYDHAGNLRTTTRSGTTTTYTHDPWNRLVKVVQASTTKAEYRYNGLNWRILKRADTDTTAGLDEERVMVYSANWQLLEERVDDSYISSYVGQARSSRPA